MCERDFSSKKKLLKDNKLFFIHGTQALVSNIKKNKNKKHRYPITSKISKYLKKVIL